MILLNLDPSNAVVTGYGPNDTVICLCDATIGAFEISLPEADGVENVTFIFIRKDTTENAITIKGRNGQNINGAESIELNENAIVIPANNSYYDLSTFSSFRTSSLLIKEGIEEPPTPPDGYIRLYSDRAHGNDLFFKFDDGSIYNLNFDPNDYALAGHTHDALYAALSDVAWLSVAESESAAIGTLGGNLALGANTISGDGAPNKGIGVGETGITAVTANAYPNGDTRTVLRLYDDTDFTEGGGAGINLYGKTSASGSYANFGGIKVSKENGVSGNNAASFYIQSKKHGSNPANALRLDSDQNGYIKNKLMVGSLTETPEALLTVYGGYDEQSIALVSDSVGPVLTLGVSAGIDGYTDVPVIRATGYSKNQLFIQHGTETPGIYHTWMEFTNNKVIIPKTLVIGEKYDSSPDGKLIAWSNSVDTLAIRPSSLSLTGLYMGITTVDSQPDCPVIRVGEYNGAHLHIQNTDGDTYIEFETIEDVKTVTIADKLVVDGDLQVDNDITLLGNFDADDKITASAINAKLYDYSDYRLYIKGYWGNIALFENYDESWKSLTVYGEIQCNTFRLNQNPTVGVITPDKYIIIKCNGTNYKIPVVAA